MDKRWIPITQVAKRLNMSRPTAREKLKKGEIPGYIDHHGIPRVEREAFEKWEENRDRGKK